MPLRRIWLRVLAAHLGLLLVWAPKAFAADPSNVDEIPCPQVLLSAPDVFTADHDFCDACADGAALRWSECKRERVLGSVRSNSQLRNHLETLVKRLTKVKDAIGDLAAVQIIPGNGWMHQSARDQPEVELAFAKIARVYRPSGASKVSIKAQEEVARLRADLLKRATSPTTEDLESGIEWSGKEPTLVAWNQSAERFSKVLQELLDEFGAEDCAALEALKFLTRYMQDALDLNGVQKGEHPVEWTPPSEENPGRLNQADFVVAGFHEGMSIEEVERNLGPRTGTIITEDFSGQGTRVVGLGYPDLDLSFEDSHVLTGFTLKTSLYSTSRGLKVGDSVKRLLQLYDKPNHIYNSVWYYYELDNDRHLMRVEFENHKVTEIFIGWDV